MILLNIILQSLSWIFHSMSPQVLIPRENMCTDNMVKNHVPIKQLDYELEICLPYVCPCQLYCRA